MIKMTFAVNQVLFLERYSGTNTGNIKIQNKKLKLSPTKLLKPQQPE